ncbi:hypothetical protein CEQ90_12785 [Lewinellaceae bacterium SD302]|nr:hypothetical protein CEQ90_12785 [Lewinellaceae bacterium SD302]
MRSPIIFFLFISCFTCLLGQGGEDNPFEIQGDASEDTRVPERPARPDNPFEIAPVPEAEPENDAVIERTDGPLLIRRDSDPAVLDARGRTLGIHILLLVFMGLAWIFFRQLISRCYSALFNEGLFNQIYRDRKNGKLGLFLFTYLIFFGAAGFFVYLAGQVMEYFPSDQPWPFWQRLSLGIAGYYLGKHLLLWLIGQLFDVEEASSKYSFLIMIFAIVTGMFLVPINLLLSYTPDDATRLILYLSLFLLALIYLLRATRALLLTSRFWSTGALHFLLYICAVELAPLLILYRVIGG